MQKAALSTIIESIASMEGYDDLMLIEIACEERRQKLRKARESPCMWGLCNGEIVDRKCNCCGQTYVDNVGTPEWKQVIHERQIHNYKNLPDIQEKTVFKRADGTWGWLDETWNDGDTVSYPTRDAAAAAQAAYIRNVLDGPPRLVAKCRQCDNPATDTGIIEQWVDRCHRCTR